MTTTSSVGSSSATTSTATAQARLSNNFDTFLQLLTTQLKNQDPTQPMDANQFTQQLVQYSQVEQQLATNSKLDNLLAAFTGNQTTTSLGYLGKTVTYDSSTVSPTSSGASWTFTPTQSGDYTVRIRDSNGVVVQEKKVSLTANQSSEYSWDGKRSDGLSMGTQPYTLELYRGTGTATTQVQVTHKGQVTAVDMTSGTPRLTVGTSNIPLARVLGIAM
ncbi:flagellar hook assembly protein FlgD [Phreatobacter oligotrophus]|jgi:flagellar basal-body rod modification protein FlgD|uniref:flagellar hook assembly protein FlgD n=1 Tax=Phreatobacter oligotrophus TaxID=1122261 RepID=UPI0023579299|nr:flagellar hook capping FlgD N-terminal domain-containing protein [Phreatobacter oligotrophus]MBX9990762.1 flagellar hook assembly protein FlgD [Phreatobacter oligotrophus]